MSSPLPNPAVCLCRTFIFQIFPEKKVQKVIFPSRTSIPLYIGIETVMGYRLCYSCVYNSETLWLLQNLPLGMYCLHCNSFLWKPRNWYRNCFISRSFPDMELTCYLLLQHTHHLYFHFLPTTHVALHYALLTADTDLYHFISNVYTGTLEMEFLTFEIKSLIDFIS